MIRRARLSLTALFGAALALGACGSSETLFEATTERLGVAIDGAPATPALTRDQVNALGFSLISVQLPDIDSRAILGGMAANRGYVTYMSANRRSFTLLGGAITSSHGMGYDLVGFRAEPGDPLVTPTPLADWPQSYLRIHRYRGGDSKIFSRAFRCVPEPLGPARIEIVELSFDLVEVAERCGNADYRYVNRLWVDPASGFVWKSLQWLGPDFGSVDVEIIRPYGG